MSWAAVLDTPVTGVRLRFRSALDEMRSELSPPPPVEQGDAND